MGDRDALTMLVDCARCIGCEACTAACTKAYDLNPNILRTDIIERKTEEYANGKQRSIYYKNACLHCTDASCVMSCPTGACHKNEDGLVVIDHDLCISCNYCAKNCPYNAITYDKASGYMEKCTLCAERYSKGETPICSEACPENAIRFGPRSEILDYADRRVKELQNKGFADANLYGDCQFGGQRVVAILDEKPEVYGLSSNPDVPITLQAFDAMPIRPTALLAAGLIIGFNFLHSRKYGRKAEEVRNKHDKAPFCYVPPGQDEDADLEAMEQEIEEKEVD